MSEYEGQQPPYQDPNAPQQPYPAQPATGWSEQPAAQPGDPAVAWPQQPAAPVRASQTGPIPADAIAAAKAEPSGMKGMFNDPSELASTGLIAAVLFAIIGGLFNFFSDPGFGGDFSTRLVALTDTVDVGDVALLGIAVALLLLTPDPPGGMGRPRLLNAATVLAAIISAFGIIRAVVVLTGSASALPKLASVIATLGVSLAAATVAFYSAKESFLKAEEDS